MVAVLKQKKLYVKLLLFFMGLAIAIVLALSVAFQSIYRNALLEEMSSTYENDLQNRSIEIEKLVEEIDYIYLSVVGNLEVERFVAMDTWNPVDEYNVKRQFSRFRNIHSKIHSMYLYNGSLGYVVTTDTAGESLTDFPDKEVFKGLTGRRQIRVREIPAAQPGEKAEQVISFLYGKFDEGGGLESCIVINVTDLAELGMLGLSDSTVTLLLDGNRKLLTANTDAIPQGELLWEQIGSEPGNYTGKDAKGGEYIVSHYPILPLGWTLVGLHDYGAVMGGIRSQTASILYLAFGILLASGALILILSRNLYLPIDAFIRKVSKANLGLGSGGRQKSELDYLMDSFSEMMEKVDQTQRSHEQIVSDTKKDFYRQALTRIQEDGELHTQAQRYGINIERAWFRTFIVKLDQYYTVAQEHRSLRKTTVRQIVSGQLEGRFDAAAVTMQGGATAAILTADEPVGEEDLLDVFRHISATVEKTLGQTVTIGLGSQVEDFDEVHSSYETAKAMAGWRLTLGYGKILTESSLPSVESPHYPEDLEKLLLESLRVDHQKEYDSAVDQLMDRLRSYDTDSAKLYLTQILLVLTNSVNQVEGKSRDSADLGRLASFLSEVEVLDQARDWFEGYYREYRTLVKEVSLRKNSKKLGTTIRQAKTFLEEHSKDPSLSIETVANHFGYTPNYFAKLFKDSTGQFINDYIRECRISQARALLAETSLTVNEVAELTGYYNTNYFFYAFKKLTGLTPSAYRASQKENR